MPYSYPLLNVYDTDHEKSDVMPIPNKKPVTNLLIFVLSYVVKRCVNPSISIGIIITIETVSDGCQNQNNIALISIPASSPVHLAHNGNCCL